jgi:hypothetical protein
VPRLGEDGTSTLRRMAHAPDTFDNPRGDDPWDNDAVQWLLRQPGGEGWTRGTLFKALRRQPGWVSQRPERVEQAAALARRHGVQQREEPYGKGSMSA